MMKQSILISDWIKNKYYLIPAYVKFGFCFSAISFFLCHLYFFTNRFANTDDMHWTSYNMWHIGSGRWADGIRLGGQYLMPGILFLMLTLSIASSLAMLISVFSVQGKISICFIALLMISFPSLAYSFVYLSTIEQHIIGIFCAIAAIFVTVRHKRGWVVGGVLLAISMGEYQSYVGFAMAVCIIFLLVETLKQQGRYFPKTLFRFLGMGIWGIGLYFAILKGILFFTDTILSSYKGIESIGRISLSELPQLIFRTYKNVFLLFMGDHFWNINIPGQLFFYTMPIVITLLMIIHILVKNKVRILYWIYAVILIALLPLCCNIIDAVAPTTQASPLNIFALFLLWAVPLILKENFEVQIEKLNIFLKNIAEFILGISLLIIIWGNALHTNQYYLKAHKTFEATAALTNRVFARLEIMPEYIQGYPVAFLGNTNNAMYDLMNNSYPDIITPQGLSKKSDFISYQNGQTTSYRVAIWIENTLGVKINSQQDTTVLQRILESDEYKNMGGWPEKDAIAVIDGTIVVNFARYSTKSLEYTLNGNQLQLTNTYCPIDQSQIWLYRFQVMDAYSEEILYSTKYGEENCFSYQFEDTGSYIIRAILKNENDYSISATSEIINVP